MAILPIKEKAMKSNVIKLKIMLDKNNDYYLMALGLEMIISKKQLNNIIINYV